MKQQCEVSKAMRCAVCGVRCHIPHSAFRIPHWHCGQASLESAIAIIGVVLLMLASFKVFLWINGRLISRQQYYECTRVAAAGSSTPLWNDRVSQVRLNMFGVQPPFQKPAECR